jgi:RimJ/RimL family protein N-acetyltransferase
MAAVPVLHVGAGLAVWRMNAANTASIRVAGKCGFKECLRGEFRGRPAVFLDRVL